MLALLAFLRSPLGRSAMIGAAVLLLVLGMRAHWIGMGSRQEQAREAQRADAARKVVAAHAVAAQAVTDKAEVQAVQTETRIRYVTRTIVQEIPAHVSPQANADYPWPVGAVRLHDASALGLDPSAVPDPAGKPDDARSAIGAADALSVIASNYGACRADQARLTELQAWVRDQAAVWEKP